MNKPLVYWGLATLLILPVSAKYLFSDYEIILRVVRFLSLLLGLYLLYRGTMGSTKKKGAKK